MGYTNYWTNSKASKTFCEDFLQTCQDIVDISSVDICNGAGDAGTRAIITKDLISLNGNAETENECEDFILSLPVTSDFEKGWCKTNRLPYDAVVKAICILAQQYRYIKDFRSDDSSEGASEHGKELWRKANALLDMAKLATSRLYVLNLVRIDAWNRAVFLCERTGRHFKTTELYDYKDGKLIKSCGRQKGLDACTTLFEELHTTSGLEGEPDSPIFKAFKRGTAFKINNINASCIIGE